MPIPIAENSDPTLSKIVSRWDETKQATDLKIMGIQVLSKLSTQRIQAERDQILDLIEKRRLAKAAIKSFIDSFEDSVRLGF